MLSKTRLQLPRLVWRNCVLTYICSRQVNIVIINACMLNCFSSVWLFATLWTLVRQTSLSVRFFRQEYWSGFPFPSPGDLPVSEPVSPALAGRFFTTKPPGNPFPCLYRSKDNFFLTSILTYTEKCFVASLHLSGALDGFGGVLHLTAPRGFWKCFLF